jgi:hypothetical protein
MNGWLMKGIAEAGRMRKSIDASGLAADVGDE